MRGFLSVLLLLLASVVGIKSAKIGNTTVEDDAWWGPNHMKRRLHDKSIRPFRLSFTHKMIEDLRYRIDNHRPFRAPLENQGFQYGFNSDQIHSWLRFWAEEYQFKQQEHFLNQYRQYKTYIQGLDIHFLKVTERQVFSKVEKVPVLMIHGWPGSVREFYETIPKMFAYNKHRDYALELIIPSLPGVGFSDAAVRPGLGAVEIGVVFRNLMHRLGHTKFYVHGGDWGAFIGGCMATLFPEEVLGYHTNLAVSVNPRSWLSYVTGSLDPASMVGPELEERMYPITNILKIYIQEFGYFHIQAAKPDTIGIALSDTPAGLLAYILQLISLGTRAAYTNSTDGGLDNHYRREQLIDNLMFYWTTNSITTSVRIYAETANLRNFHLGVWEKPTPVPTWTLHAKDEILYQTPALLKYKFTNLVHSTVLKTGGHFLALEMPEVLAEDLTTAIEAFRNFKDTSCYKTEF